MTFEEFFECCTFDIQYLPLAETKTNFVILVFFDNPHGKSWTHVNAVGDEAILALETVNRYIAGNLYSKLKADKVI